MAAKYTDDVIGSFIRERKPLSKNFQKDLKLKDKRGHKEQEIDVVGTEGNRYKLIVRQNSINALDFSIILTLCSKDSNLLFRLRRYNGKSHEHTDKIESRSFYDFHIHTATELYQELGEREDSYAEPTDRYSDFRGALDCMFADCGFDISSDNQMSLF